MTSCFFLGGQSSSEVGPLPEKEKLLQGQKILVLFQELTATIGKGCKIINMAELLSLHVDPFN